VLKGFGGGWDSGTLGQTGEFVNDYARLANVPSASMVGEMLERDGLFFFEAEKALIRILFSRILFSRFCPMTV